MIYVQTGFVGLEIITPDPRGMSGFPIGGAFTAGDGSHRHRRALIGRPARAGTGEGVGRGAGWRDTLCASARRFAPREGAAARGATCRIGDGAPGEGTALSACDTRWISGEGESGSGGASLRRCTDDIAPAGEIAGDVACSHMIVVKRVCCESGVDEG